jgi:hypothetical protein
LSLSHDAFALRDNDKIRIFPKIVSPDWMLAVIKKYPETVQNPLSMSRGDGGGDILMQ